MTKHGKKHRLQITLTKNTIEILKLILKRTPQANPKTTRSLSSLIEHAILKTYQDPIDLLTTERAELAKKITYLTEQITTIREKREDSQHQRTEPR